jgi:vacuolar-type H+-ATPase subunit H
MDILHLIDRLEELFNESRTVPFTRNVVVDEDRMLDIIDQMRVTIPEEFKKAQQLAAQKDRILAQAQEEANRIVQLAREKAEQMVEREAVLRSAQNRADQILSQARADAQATRQDADDYVIDSLRPPRRGNVPLANPGAQRIAQTGGRPPARSPSAAGYPRRRRVAGRRPHR